MLIGLLSFGCIFVEGVVFFTFYEADPYMLIEAIFCKFAVALGTWEALDNNNFLLLDLGD
jgi:hypothetical protein